MSQMVAEFAKLYGELVDRIKDRGRGELAAFMRKTGWSRSTLYNPANENDPRAAMQIGADRIAVVGKEAGASDSEINRVIIAWFRARTAFGPFGAVASVIFPALDTIPAKTRTILSRFPEIPAEVRDRVATAFRDHVDQTYKSAIDAYIADVES